MGKLFCSDEMKLKDTLQWVITFLPFLGGGWCVFLAFLLVPFLNWIVISFSEDYHFYPDLSNSYYHQDDELDTLQVLIKGIVQLLLLYLEGVIFLSV